MQGPSQREQMVTGPSSATLMYVYVTVPLGPAEAKAKVVGKMHSKSTRVIVMHLLGSMGKGPITTPSLRPSCHAHSRSAAPVTPLKFKSSGKSPLDGSRVLSSLATRMEAPA